MENSGSRPKKWQQNEEKMAANPSTEKFILEESEKCGHWGKEWVCGCVVRSTHYFMKRRKKAWNPSAEMLEAVASSCGLTCEHWRTHHGGWPMERMIEPQSDGSQIVSLIGDLHHSRKN